jgi:hypothetical protein
LRQTAVTLFRSQLSGNVDAPFALKHAFPAAVAQICVQRRFGFTFNNARLEGLLLLGIFGFGGFVVGSVLRLIGLRKQYGGL